MTKWDIDSCAQPSGSTTQDNDKRFQWLLDDGWEPFAVTYEDNIRLVWFRKSYES